MTLDDKLQSHELLSIPFLEEKTILRYDNRSNKKRCCLNTTMDLETDSCKCSHQRFDHQHLIGRDRRYPCQKCTCPDFRKK